MSGALLILLSIAQAPRAALAEIEIRGPRAGLTLELAGAGRAELTLAEPLLAGERRSTSLAVPLPPDDLPEGVWAGALERALAVGDQGRLLHLEPSHELMDVSADLLARPRPTLSGHAPRLSWSALFVVGAAFAIALARRRQPLVATGIALLASASVFLLTRSVSARRLSAVRILEANFDADPARPWLAIETRLGGFEDALIASARFETEPRRASLRCRTQDLALGSATRVSIEAPGASVVALRSFDPSPRRLTREVNAWGNFEQAWLREADGRWLALGRWPLGEALPTGVPSEPPGWLVPPLPMGRTLFVGQLAQGEAIPAFHPTAGGSETAIWVRGLGL